MDKNQVKSRIEKLKKLIRYHRYLYHVLDKQEISDSALDSLKKELFDLEQSFPEFITPDSPTQRIGGSPLGKFEKTKHSKPMLSFNDAFSQEDMKDWEQRIKKLISDKSLDYFCEVKFDGLAIELIYRNGLLKIGSTRGNGLIGENITQNLKTIESIPLRLREKKEIIADLEKQGFNKAAFLIKKQGFKEIVARGEALISKKEFSKINIKQDKKGLPKYANPRNIAAGSIRQLDSKVTASRNLEIYIYDLISDLGQKTHEEEHKILKILGFKTHKATKLYRNLEGLFEYHKLWQKKRNSLPFEIDGLVVRVNNNEIFEKLGVVGKAPRGTIAFKFPFKQAQTKVEDIKIQIGRTGAITPVAHLKPIEIGGTTVTRATLHNESEIKRLGIKVYDTVIVGRAGDVIPDIIKVLKELRNGREKEFIMPKKCPICSTLLEKKEKEVILRCPNTKCSARQRRNIYHFVSKSAFNIEGVGPKIIDHLLNQNLIADAADLFELKEGDIVPLERFAEKSAQNIIAAIQSSKKIELWRFIYALGLRGVGEETTQDLANYFRNIESLKKANVEDLFKIKDIGPETANSIHSFFSLKSNLDLLFRLKRNGVEIISPVFTKISNKLIGKTFVLTGEMVDLTRNQAKEKIRSQGGDISGSVSKNTDFVVVGENPGLKLDKAKKLGVKIINEKEFLAILR